MARPSGRLLKEVAWTLGPPLVVALLLLGLLWSSPPEALAENYSDSVPTGQVCRGQECVELSNGEWQLQHRQMLLGKSWMLVGVVGFLSGAAALVRWERRMRSPFEL